MLRKKKTDLFGMWLDFNQDWDRVQCEVERRSESTNLSRSEWCAIQAKELRGKMESSKFDELIKKRVEAGLFYKDHDFPDDPEDRGSDREHFQRVWQFVQSQNQISKISNFKCSPQLSSLWFAIQENWIYMPKGRLVRQDDLVSDSVKAKATKKLDETLFNALTAEEGGILPTGSLPSIKATSEAGQRAIVCALGDESKAVPKPKKAAKPKGGEAEKVTPKTIHEPGPQKFLDIPL